VESKEPAVKSSFDRSPVVGHLAKARVWSPRLEVLLVLIAVLTASTFAQSDMKRGLTPKEKARVVAFLGSLDEKLARFDRDVSEAQQALAAGDCYWYRYLRDSLIFRADELRKETNTYLGASAGRVDRAKSDTLAEEPEWDREHRIAASLPEDCTPKPAPALTSDSVVPELERGVLDGYELVTRPTLDGLVGLLADAAKACDRARYKRYRKELQEGFNKERSDLVKASVEKPDSDPRIAKMAAVLSKYPLELVCANEVKEEGERSKVSLAPGLDPYSPAADCLEDGPKLETAAADAIDKLRAMKQDTANAMRANGGTWSERFAFLLAPGNVFERHEERLHDLLERLEDGRKTDCNVRYAIQTGVDEIDGRAQRFGTLIATLNRKQGGETVMKILANAVAQAEQFNSREFF